VRNQYGLLCGFIGLLLVLGKIYEWFVGWLESNSGEFGVWLGLSFV